MTRRNKYLISACLYSHICANNLAKCHPFSDSTLFICIFLNMSNSTKYSKSNVFSFINHCIMCVHLLFNLYVK